MDKLNNAKCGFTLKDFIITIFILAIVAAISIPAYFNHTRRTYFSEIVQATVPYKTGVAECYRRTTDLRQCAAGANTIPPAITIRKGAIASLLVENGIISVTPVAAHGVLATDTYILTPSVVDNVMSWTASGGGVAAGYEEK
jgi:type IV pilus assembly protein PilA